MKVTLEGLEEKELRFASEFPVGSVVQNINGNGKAKYLVTGSGLLHLETLSHYDFSERGPGKPSYFKLPVKRVVIEP